MFPEYFFVIETVVAAILAVFLGYKYVQHRKNHHLLWLFFLIFWSTFELVGFLHLVYGSSPITEKIVSLLHMPAMALSGIGMLFLLQGFDLFPKVTVRKTLPRYFLVYTLIVYSALIGAVLVASVQQTATVFSWVLLVIPGVFITISGSVSSFFLGRKKNILIAIGLLLAIVGEQIGWVLWHSRANWLDTLGETLMGVGFLIAIELSTSESG
jgi:hypothetical protein